MSQTSQPAHPTLINIPQPPSNPDTPSEMPGTPTSTTTSLSALSTTAIKDGHRGHALAASTNRGHGHHASTNSLEAERADRISRLPGMSTMNTLRPPHPGNHHPNSNQTTPTSSGFPGSGTGANPFGTVGGLTGLTPAYFDANGQPVAATKMSTVGTASATESIGGRTLGEGGDQDMADNEDMLSTDTNFRETEMDDASGYMGGVRDGEVDPMDEDLANRSVGGFEDRMSDDGSASLVGFGEGAGSTVSGPIYHRRPLPMGSSTGAMAQHVWGLERSSSGLSDMATVGSSRRDGPDTPVSFTTGKERRDARMVDGVATDGGITSNDMYVDTTTRGPIPVGQVQPQPPTSAVRETQQPQSHQQQAQQIHTYLGHPSPVGSGSGTTSSEAVERMVRSLDDGESRVSGAALGSPKAGERLGRFYFEESK